MEKTEIISKIIIQRARSSVPHSAPLLRKELAVLEALPSFSSSFQLPALDEEEELISK